MPIENYKKIVCNFCGYSGTIHRPEPERARSACIRPIIPIDICGRTGTIRKVIVGDHGR